MVEVTGQELNLFERAGYFIRRRWVPVEVRGSIAAQTERLIHTIAEDLLGASILKEQWIAEGSQGFVAEEWAEREGGGKVQRPGGHELGVDIVSAGVYELAVVPGSHGVHSRTGDSAQDWEGRVCITLADGDAFFFNPAVLRRVLRAEGAIRRYRFVALV